MFLCVTQVMKLIAVDVALSEHHPVPDAVLGLGGHKNEKTTLVSMW